MDLVRHGQSVDNLEKILGTVPPGAPLTELGEQQAHEVALLIHADYPNGFDGIYASELVRGQSTAQPLADLLHTDLRVLPGLNEINAGFLEGANLTTITEVAYILPAVLWILGLYFVPVLGSTIDPNGMAFQDRVSDAVQTIYNNSAPENGAMTSVAFAHAGTIAAWTLMNVKNPDLSLVVKDLIDTHQPLPNTGQVVIQGSPEDGWKLLSWNGTAVPAQPDFLTSLFVGFRDVITAPQMALWHLWESLIGGGGPATGDVAPNGSDDALGGVTGVPTDDGAALADLLVS